ncbi:tetraspanin Tsp2 family [Crassisporium funariophilum]|nr:tetraspanin Tsp2 family [Crassisporium funariophilum]
MNQPSTSYHQEPSTPGYSRDVSPAPGFDPRPGLLPADSSSHSLTVNYLPTKFSSGALSPIYRRRNGGKGTDRFSGTGVPKMGGGVDAFRSGESRMGGEPDYLDEDAGSGRWFFGKAGRRGRQGRKKTLRWNKFKWILLGCNTALTIYSFVALIFCLLTWFDVWDKADIIRVANHAELSISTLAACMGIFTSLIGWAGILMNNRSFLAVYTFLLWITFIFLVIPGYLTYKRRTFNLEGKVNAQWSRSLGALGRMRVQNQLRCCGYFSPFVEATISQTCYARSILPGCKLGFLIFEREVLKRWYTVSFGLVPVHLLVMVAGLLCSNHVTYRFGKGMMPKAYRLSMTSMAIIMDNYASQLAEQYGTEVASEVIARSRSNLQLDSMPTMPYAASGSARAGAGTKYDSLSTDSGLL